MKLLQKITKNKTLVLVLVPLLVLGAFAGQFVYANVLTAGYCWNGNIGWVNMAGVDYDAGTRAFTGSASFHYGKYLSGVFADGEIDFTAQGGTSLALTLSGSQNGDGNFPILGQAFSEEIGWVFADHGGTAGTEAAVTPSGELTGNFWSNEFGWIQCDAASIGVSNTQVWDLASIIVSVPSLIVAENAGTNTFDVRLGSQPTADVVVDLSSNDTAEATVSPATMTFTNGNWNVDQTATVTGVPDTAAGDDTATIMVSVNDALSDDQYDPVVDESVTITVPDDENPADDTDGDGVPNSEELSAVPPTDPNDPDSFEDTDGDGVPNYVENNAVPPTNPNDDTEFTDTDGDGVPDYVEENGTPATNPNDATDYTDTDGDGASDYFEENASPPTDPNDSSSVTDTDGDGVPDAIDPNPTTPGDTLVDTDGDGVPDIVEENQGTDPNDNTDFQDTDGDGVADYIEGVEGTDSNNANDLIDSDGDGVGDSVENKGFNGGDADGDGVQDATQQSVSGSLNPVTGKNATLKSVGSCEFITENEFISEGALAADDSSADYPVGLVDFQVQCTTPGDSTDVTIYYDQAYDTSTWSYKKFDGSGNVYSDITDLATFGTHTYITGPETGNTVTTVSFTVTDGDPRTDEDGIVDGFINDPSGPAVAISSSTSSSKKGGSRRVVQSVLDKIFGRNSDVEQEEPVVAATTIPVTTPSTGDTLGGGEQCSASQILTQNLKTGARNGVYHSYTKSMVTEANILQAHMNRLGFASGPEDGIIGPISDGAIKRMQTFLGTTPDGYVGPITRGLLNNSCGTGTTEIVQAVTTPVVTQTITTSQCSFPENLKPGAENNNVLSLQNFLKDQGFLTATPNGYYGPATTAAVVAFQNKYPEIYTNAGLTSASVNFYTNSRAKAIEICER